jgi:hypothetical protein
MELPDVTQLTEQQWDQLVAAIQQAREAKEIERQLEHDALSGDISSSVAALDKLIGPLDPPRPTMTRVTSGGASIREMRTFNAAELGANSGLAHAMSLAALEKLAVTVRNIAAVR